MKFLRKKYFYLSFPFLFLLGSFILWKAFSSTTSLSKTKKYIAYIGRYTDYKDSLPYNKQQKTNFDMLHETTLKDYIKTLNDSLSEIELELITFDNHKNSLTSDSIYKEKISNNKDILFVVDNTWGENIGACSETIKKNNIPVIAINADKNNLDFGSAALFTGNDDNVPHDIVAFLTKVLKVKEINFISETDYPLHHTFLNAFKDAGIDIHHSYDIQGKLEFSEKQKDSILQGMIECYNHHAHEPVLVINTHRNWGIKIIETVEKKLNNVTMAGGAFIANFETLKEFGKNTSNELYIMSYPKDAMSKKIHNDFTKFFAGNKKYFENPNAPFFIKRCWNIMEITQDLIKNKGDSSKLSRDDARSYFNSLVNKTVQGEFDLYTFDDSLIMIRDIDFAKYKKGKLYSVPIQLSREREIIPNVFFGIDIVDIFDIDVSQNCFSADFFYWTKIDTAFKNIEENIIFQNIQQTQSQTDLILEKIDEDVVYKLYKVSGKFYNNYELNDYPIDKQELEIKIEILKPSNKLKISFDQTSLDTDLKLLERFRVPAWDKKSYYFTVDNRITSSMRGDPENDEGKPTIFKNFTFRLNIERKFFSPFLEIILPLSLIGFVAIALLYVKDISFENLGEVSVGTFLGIITFSIALSNITPSADYLTKADMFFWLTFTVVLTCFMTVIVVNARYKSDIAKDVNINIIKYGIGVLYPLIAIALFLF